MAMLKNVVWGVILFFPLPVFWQDKSESGSWSLGQIISVLCLLPQRLEMALPGVLSIMELVYVSCLSYQSLKNYPWLPQYWLASWVVRKAANWNQNFTSWVGSLSVWKSAASHGWLAAKDDLAPFWCSIHVAFFFLLQLLTFLWPFFPTQRKDTAGLSVLTQSLLS